MLGGNSDISTPFQPSLAAQSLDEIQNDQQRSWTMNAIRDFKFICLVNETLSISPSHWKLSIRFSKSPKFL